MKKIAVVGGGAFGCSAAWMLARDGHEVTLFERRLDILQAASGINQYRLHRGYHYPRSADTATSSLSGLASFAREYGDCIVGGTQHFYAIAKEDSLVNAEEYISFCEKVNLQYSIANCPVLRPEKLQLCIQAEEALFDHLALREKLRHRLNEFTVRIVHQEFASIQRDSYDFLVYALYANTNLPFLDRSELQRPLQFELCEKPVVQLSSEYDGVSVVIMDGPFMCIDPLGNTSLSVMGNVEHAIHRRDIGLFPDVPAEYKEIIDAGVVNAGLLSRFPAFIEHAKQFFHHLNTAQHKGSMFTIRTVLPHCEGDDRRPTMVDLISEREVSLFSGKIGTCVDAAIEVCELVRSK